MRNLAAFLILILTASPLLAEDRNSRAWRLATATYVTSVGLDLYSTDKVLNTGRAKELNPLLGEHPSDSRVYLRGAAISGLLYFGISKIENSLPRTARTALIVLSVVHFGAAVHNLRLRNDLEQEGR